MSGFEAIKARSLAEISDWQADHPYEYICILLGIGYLVNWALLPKEMPLAYEDRALLLGHIEELEEKLQKADEIVRSEFGESLEEVISWGLWGFFGIGKEQDDD